jgi:LysM repeat protein
LISLIERYDLHQYDELTIVATKSTSKNKYIIQQGDTLYSVARKFSISVSGLMKLNNLSTSALSIGQQLIVK